MEKEKAFTADLTHNFRRVVKRFRLFAKPTTFL